MKWLAGTFLIANAVVHVAVWAFPATTAQPFDPRRSWLTVRLGVEHRARAVAAGTAVAAAVIFMIAGIGVITDSEWAPGAAVVGGALSLLLTVVCFHPWLTFNVVINVVIILLVVR